MFSFAPPLQVNVSNVDRMRTAATVVTLVVVELVEVGVFRREIKYRLCGLAGQVISLFTRSYLAVVQGATNPAAHGMAHIPEMWRSMPKCSIAANLGALCPLGKQGITRCLCAGATCQKGKCGCLARGVLCTHRCHREVKGSPFGRHCSCRNYVNGSAGLPGWDPNEAE